MAEDDNMLLREVVDSKTQYNSRDGNDESRRRKAKRPCFSLSAIVVLIILLLASSFASGFLLAYMLFEDDDGCGSNCMDSTISYGTVVRTDSGETISAGEMLSRNIIPENIKKNLR